MKNLITIITFLLFTTLLISQERDHEKIKALKVGYLTEQLELTPAEAELFWPVYNAYDAKHSALREEERDLMRTSNSEINELTETEARAILEKIKAIEREEERAEIDYIKNLETVLSYKKILKLFRSEKDFRRQLLHRLRDQKTRKQRRPR